MGDRIEKAPDTSDERLVELVRWTSKAGMPDVHALLLDLQRRRASQRPDADGDLSDDELQRWLQSVPYARYEPVDMQRMAREIVRHRAAEFADAGRIRRAIVEAVTGHPPYGALLTPNDRHADAIADRVAALLTAPNPTPPGAP